MAATLKERSYIPLVHVPRECSEPVDAEFYSAIEDQLNLRLVNEVPYGGRHMEPRVDGLPEMVRCRVEVGRAVPTGLGRKFGGQKDGIEWYAELCGQNRICLDGVAYLVLTYEVGEAS